MPAFDPGNLKSSQPPESVSASDAVPGSGSDSRLFEATQDQSEHELERARRQSASPPAEVPGYEFEGFLGAGAYGSVWKARQESTGKRVAIKFYEHRGGLDWSFLSREVEKLAFLYTDRDVVQLIDVGWDAAPPFYIMEYLERGSLDQLMARGRVSVEEAVRIVRDVGQALVHAHGRGILHCDLKPANVLLDNDWKVRLADFGQSRLSHEQVPALGTLFYMAPEQADLKAVPDARWDVYALGALLFHLLTGDPPHRTSGLEARLKAAPKLADRLDEYRRAIKSAPTPTAPRKLRGVDRILAEIVEGCLAADPEQRYPNAQAVIEALDRRARGRARRPLILLGGVVPLLVFGVIISMGVLGWANTVEQSKESRVRQARATNRFAASGQARLVQLELEKLSSFVRQAGVEVGKQKELCDFLQGHQGEELEADTIQDLIQNENHVARTFVDEIRDRFADAPFKSWVVFNTQGVMIARSPLDEGLIGDNFQYRDYYQGLMDRLDEVQGESQDNPVYISRVFKSKAAEGFFMFGMSTPARNAEGRLLGVLFATITANSLPLSVGEGSQLMTVLVGREDENKPSLIEGADNAAKPLKDGVPDYQIFVHPMYPSDVPDLDALPIDDAQRAFIENFGKNHLNHDLGPEDGLYVDPVALAYEQDSRRWLPGVFPVAGTPFFVFVQEPYDEVIQPVDDLASDLRWLGGKALGLGVILLAGAWYFVQRAMQRQDGRGLWTMSGPPAEAPTVTETWGSASGSGDSAHA